MVLNLCGAAGVQELATALVQQGKIVAAVLAPDRQVEDEVLNTAPELQRGLAGGVLLAALDGITPQRYRRRLITFHSLVRAESEPQGKSNKKNR